MHVERISSFAGWRWGLNLSQKRMRTKGRLMQGVIERVLEAVFCVLDLKFPWDKWAMGG